MTLEELYRLLRSSHVQAQGIVDTLREPLVVLDRNLTVVSANPSFYSAFRTERDATLGHSLFEIGNGHWDIPDLRALLLEVVPKASAIVDYKVSREFKGLGRRTMLVTARRLAHPDENSTQMLIVFKDVTEQLRAEAEREVLLAESQHRMKNLLAVLRAVAAQTGTDGLTAEQYRAIVIGRFEAVINAQMFAADHGANSELAALARQVLEPVAGQRVVIAVEPQVLLAPHQLLPLSMILHEMGTNAVKYGALSRAEGRVHIGWQIEERDGKRQLLLNWREDGGPKVAPPQRRGFGMQLIEHGIRAEGGEIKLDFEPAGLRASFTLPVEA